MLDRVGVVPSPASSLRSVAELREHASAALVPAMAVDDYAALRADIAERGLLVPLEISAAGVVLDGHHRLRAARELSVGELAVRVVTPEDEVVHMLRAALNRRHLTASQKAALAIELDEHQRACEQALRTRRANLRGSTEVATLPPRGERSRELAARTAGVSERTVQDVETVRQADPDLFNEIKAGRVPAHRAARQVRRAQRYDQIQAAPALPTEQFDVIYADPPWQLGNPSSAYAPENHYPTLNHNEIAALDVPSADDAVLFLWIPSSLLPDGLSTLDAWGFDYKTSLVWVKNSIGLGSWVRHRHEHLLLGRKGNHPPPERTDLPDSVIEAKRGRHSEKPRVVYELIERMYPQASKLELFARGKPRPGWNAWGNEVQAV